MNDKNTMKQAIKERLQNPAWDLEMARRVHAEKRKRSRLMGRSIIGGLAAAALVTLVVTFALTENEPTEPAGYDTFLAQQVQGTYEMAFDTSVSGETDGNAGSSTSVDYLSSNIDGFISETLESRY
jgi:hypothetical protein